jgi:putative hydrolase of the HAD superfamily
VRAAGSGWRQSARAAGRATQCWSRSERLIRAAVLDYGNVLSLEQEGESVCRLEGLTGAEAALFAAAYWRHRIDYDRGIVSGEAYWRRVGADLGVELSGERIRELVHEDAVSWTRLNDRMVAWLAALLAAGVPTAILSNMTRDSWGLVGPRFDGVASLTLSFEVGAVKPEPEIYERCLADLGVEAAEAFFVDDRLENVEAARALGMEALVFEGEDALAAELRRLRVDWPLP